MVTTIAWQYPTDEDKHRLARQVFDYTFQIADEIAGIAHDLEAEGQAAGISGHGIREMPLMEINVHRAREAAQRHDWNEMNERLGFIMQVATRGIEDGPARDLPAAQQFLDKADELARARSRLNQDIAAADFATREEYRDSNIKERIRVQDEAGYPSGHRLREWL